MIGDLRYPGDESHCPKCRSATIDDNKSETLVNNDTSIDSFEIHDNAPPMKDVGIFYAMLNKLIIAFVILVFFGLTAYYVDTRLAGVFLGMLILIYKNETK